MPECRVPPKLFRCQETGEFAWFAHASFNCSRACHYRAVERLIREYRYFPGFERTVTFTNVTDNWQRPLAKLEMMLRNGWEPGQGGSRYRSGGKKYVWERLSTFEEGELNGMKHLHLAQRGSFVDQWWLSTLAEHVGFGFRVDIRAVDDPQGALRYVLKYATKQAGRKGKKMYSTSRNLWRPGEREYAAHLKTLEPKHWRFDRKATEDELLNGVTIGQATLKPFPTPQDLTDEEVAVSGRKPLGQKYLVERATKEYETSLEAPFRKRERRQRNRQPTPAVEQRPPWSWPSVALTGHDHPAQDKGAEEIVQPRASQTHRVEGDK